MKFLLSKFRPVKTLIYTHFICLYVIIIMYICVQYCLYCSLVLFKKVSPILGFSIECVCIVNCSDSPDTQLIKMHCSYICSGCGQYIQCAKYNIEIYIECNNFKSLAALKQFKVPLEFCFQPCSPTVLSTLSCPHTIFT